MNNNGKSYKPYQLIKHQYFTIPLTAANKELAAAAKGVMLTRYNTIQQEYQWLPKEFPGISEYIELVKCNGCDASGFAESMALHNRFNANNRQHGVMSRVDILLSEIDGMRAAGVFLKIPDNLNITVDILQQIKLTHEVPSNINVQAAIYRIGNVSGERKRAVAKNLVRNIISVS